MADYITEVEGEVYFQGVLNSDAWDAASPQLRGTAITNATSIIDRLRFVGCKTDENQENQFPRGGDTTVPQDVKNACAEIANALLDGKDPELEFENQRMTSQKYSDTQSTYDRTSYDVHILAGVPSVTAWRFLLPYLRSDRDFTRIRES
jgi:hypothetical protein